jgi:transketolase
VRDAFLEELLDIAAADERVMLLTGDLGFTVLEPFAERFPDRFHNVGVAEQNMVGMATGLAEAGMRPYVYSIATFVTMRPYEFIRNGPVLHELPVRIVGVGSGFDYGHNGISHYALEDIAIMRAQPGLTVVAPADARQARTALRTTADVERPVYYRIGKGAAPLVELDGRFRLGRTECIGAGEDVAIVALGSMAGPAVEAAALLAQRGLGATVAVVSSFGPAPRADLAELLAQVPLALSAEAAYVDGGLGSLVAEVIAEERLACGLVRCGVRSMPRGLTGSAPWLYRHHGLDPESLANAALSALDLTGR